MWKIKGVLFGRFLRTSGPGWDGTAFEVQHEGNQPAVDGVENIVMSGYFNCAFWQCVIPYFRGLTLFDDSAETMPLLIVVAVEEAVATTCRTKVTGDNIGAAVGCEFYQSALGWR
jgi:hypothetical protein